MAPRRLWHTASTCSLVECRQRERVRIWWLLVVTHVLPLLPVTPAPPQEAVLSSGEVVPFDYVAIASGSSYGDTLHAAGPEAVTRQGRLGQLQVG